MEDSIMNENFNDEFVVDEQNQNDDIDVAAIGNGLKIGAAALAIVGIAGVAAYKKFGPQIAEKMADHRRKVLLKKQAKLAKKSLEIEELLAKFEENKEEEETK